MNDPGDEDEGVTYHDTLAAALAEAMVDAEDGSEVAIHAEGCPVDTEVDCTCDPEIVIVRRGAA